VLTSKTLGGLSLIPPISTVAVAAASFAWIVGVSLTANAVAFFIPLSIIAVAVLASLGVVVVFVVDAARRPRLENRAVWLLLIVILGPFGPLLYWLVPIRATARQDA
jgi:drug/metabolite transporter (DMT)-like permease